MIETTCYFSWIGDTWCDTNCMNDECNYDGGDCNANSNNDNCGAAACGVAYSIFTIASEINGSSELITHGEWCAVYSLLQSYLPDDEEQGNNCSQSFTIMDENNNSYIGFYEGLSGIGILDADAEVSRADEKLLQINCSICMNDPSLYYY